MLSSKTRTTILALVASASIGCTAVAPAVSQAQTNWPALGHAIHCESLLAGREAYEHKAEAAQREGNPNLADYYRGMAHQYEGEMLNELCITPSPSSTPGKPVVSKPVFSKPVTKHPVSRAKLG
jgi:hypothetical protein